MQLSHKTRAALFFLLPSVIWGSTWIVIKDQLYLVPPAWSVTYRFAIASVVMFLLAWTKDESALHSLHGHAIAAALGLFEFFLEYNLVYAAEQHITSGIVAVVFALLFIPNALLSWLIFHQRLPLRFIVGSGVAVVGVTLLIIQEAYLVPATGAGSTLGVGLAVMGVLSASLANVFQMATRVKSLPLARLLAWAMLYAVVFNAIFAITVAGLPVVEARPGYWFGLLYLGVVASALAFWLYFGLIRMIGPANAAYTGVLVPIIAMSISTFAEGYRWSAAGALGATLAVSGMVLALYPRAFP